MNARLLHVSVFRPWWYLYEKSFESSIIEHALNITHLKNIEICLLHC